jgi:hypothetical protein
MSPGLKAAHVTAEQDRIGRIETRQWEQQQEIAILNSKIASLETSRDNERTRHASTPAWIFGVLSIGIALVGPIAQSLPGGREAMIMISGIQLYWFILASLLYFGAGYIGMVWCKWAACVGWRWQRRCFVGQLSAPALASCKATRRLCRTFGCWRYTGRRGGR